MKDQVVDAEPITNVLVSPETITAFNACDAVKAYDELAIVDVELDTYVLNQLSSNLPVPIAWPFNEIEPVILTLPVNECVSSCVSPNLVEPD